MKEVLINLISKAGKMLGWILKILGIITLVLTISLIVQACGLIHAVFH